MLTMTRNSGPRSNWPEFELKAAQWDIPAERTKMGQTPAQDASLRSFSNTGRKS